MAYKATQQKQVSDTMELMGQEVPKSFVFPIDQLLNRIKWLESEITELKVAIQTGNIKEFIDAIEDSRTVLNGFYVDTGINETLANKAYERVTQSNMTKYCKHIYEAIKTVIHYSETKNIEAAIKVMLPSSPFSNYSKTALDKWKLDFMRGYEEANTIGHTIEIRYQIYRHNLQNQVYFVVVDAKNDKYLKSIHFNEPYLDDIVECVTNINPYNLVTPSAVVRLNDMSARVLHATTLFNNLFIKYNDIEPLAFADIYKTYREVVNIYSDTEYSYKSEEDIDIDYYHEDFIDSLTTLENDLEGLCNYFNINP